MRNAVVRHVVVGPMDTNAYLVRCTATGARLLIDAGDDVDALLGMLRADDGGTGLDTVVTTHRHDDHHAALVDLVAATGARTAAGTDDADALPAPTDVRLAHDDVLGVGALALEVVQLRGHTPGSIALVLRDATAGPGAVTLFSGDSLFPGGVGATGGDPQRFTSLLDDVETRVFAELPDATVVRPGHGAPTTLGAERPQLPQWRARGW